MSSLFHMAGERQVPRLFATCRSASGFTSGLTEAYSDHVLEGFQRKNLDDVARGFCLEHDFFLGKGVDAFACWGGGLAYDFNLHQTVEVEYAGAAF